MAVTTAGRVRTLPGVAALAALLLVLLFGNPAYVDWQARHASANTAWGFFLKTLAWPNWSFSSTQSIQTVLADDIKAILLILFTAVFVSALVGGRGALSGFFAGWGGYIFAAALAGFLAAFIQQNASLLGAFGWASLGAVYGLFTGWIVGLFTLIRR
jgi:hypothetical protein